MMSMQPGTRISEFNLSLKDILTIITILASAMGSYFTISSQITQLASKFEDYRANQEKLYQSEKGLIDLQLRMLELRIERMEQQNLKR